MKLCDLNLSRSNVHPRLNMVSSLMLETQQIIIITIVLSVSDSWRGRDLGPLQNHCQLSQASTSTQPLGLGHLATGTGTAHC